MEKRYFYKSLDGKSWFSLKNPEFKGNENYVEITESEYYSHLYDLTSILEKEE